MYVSRNAQKNVPRTFYFTATQMSRTCRDWSLQILFFARISWGTATRLDRNLTRRWNYQQDADLNSVSRNTSKRLKSERKTSDWKGYCKADVWHPKITHESPFAKSGNLASTAIRESSENLPIKVICRPGLTFSCDVNENKQRALIAEWSAIFRRAMLRGSGGDEGLWEKLSV